MLEGMPRDMLYAVGLPHLYKLSRHGNWVAKNLAAEKKDSERLDVLNPNSKNRRWWIKED